MILERKQLALVLVVLLMFAGCASQGDVSEPRDTPTTDVPKTSSPTATPTPEPPDNPWQQEVVYISVSNTVNDRNFTPLVNKTLDYWNQNAGAYGDYEVTFQLAGDEHQPDITVWFVTNIGLCKPTDDDKTIGCAPIIINDGSPRTSATVKIETGYTNNSTEATLKHEFGHVLGIEHGEEPMPLMAETGNVTMLPQENATERALPWKNSTLSVYVGLDDVHRSDRDEYREQIQHVLEYYEAGAEGTVSENITFARTENRTAADIAIAVSDKLECDGGEESCVDRYGFSVDADDEFEYYSRYNITIVDVDQDATGWFIGYWLGFGLGVNEATELAPPFQDADYEDRRDEWWE